MASGGMHEAAHKHGYDKDSGNCGYGGDRWALVETTVSQSLQPQSQPLFSVGNGLIGIRGCFEEDVNASGFRTQPAVYLNGVYDVFPIRYHEAAYGFPTTTDTRIPVPDGTLIEIFANDERFCLNTGVVLEYSRRLDFQKGLLTRTVRLKMPSGRIIDVKFERLVSFTQGELACIKITVLPINFSDQITIVSSIDKTSLVDASTIALEEDGPYDPRIGPGLEYDPWNVISRHNEAKNQGFVLKTKTSGITVAALMTHAVDQRLLDADEVQASENRISRIMKFVLREGQTGSLTKYLSYATDYAVSPGDPLAVSSTALERTEQQTFETIADEQVRFLRDFWYDAAIDLPESPELGRALHLNLFQLMQSTGRDDLTSISAKGQTGEGYEGHVFWDAETYVLPFFIFNRPEIARSMLMYRFNGLTSARSSAAIMGHKRGALFPWRTIGGTECSSYFPAGSAEYHVNADIAYAIKQYVDATGDYDFLAEFGAEMLVETARLWIEVGFFNEAHDGKFCINNVTGPDEYSALVDNNFFTNAMAKLNLEYALESLEYLQHTRSSDYTLLVKRLKIGSEECKLWREAAGRMFLPYSDEFGIYMQDGAFLTKKMWDFAQTSPDKYPLLLHYHPLTIYRHQVCKQADVVLALFLVAGFDQDTMRRTYEYYEKVTTHDSTLSAGIFSIVANRIGEPKKAAAYLKRAMLTDIENQSNNSDHGLHMAAMGSAWMALVFGFAGMKLSSDKLVFDPIHVDEIGPYKFKVRISSCSLSVDVRQREVIYELLSGKSMTLYHFNVPVRLVRNQARTCTLS